MNTPVTCFTALISIAEEEQCDELEGYLRSKGSDITTSNDTELLVRLQTIIQECSVVLENKEISQQELEGFFYSVVSLFHVVSFDDVKGVLDSFCSKILEVGTPENAEWRMKLFGLMFCHFSIRDSLSFTTFCYRVKMAAKMGKPSALALDIDQLKKWVEIWKLDETQKRNLFLLLWGAHRNHGDNKICICILKELLSTYTESDATDGTSYAKDLIFLIVSEPTCFIFDDVLNLAPVKTLEGQKIHDMLKIFVHDNISSFETFYSINTAFLDELGLEYSLCVTKMRRLTLASMAVKEEVIPFSSLRDELQLSLDELEDFVFTCIRLKLIEARINQLNQTLVIISSIHRTFKKEQWELLHDRLLSWQQSIQSLGSSLKSIKI